MGEILDEFEFISLNDEYKQASEEELANSYTSDSNKLIEQAKNFFEENKNSTYQGISVDRLNQCMVYGKSEIVPWNHTQLVINLSIIRDINDRRILELYIPPFIEEICSSQDKMSHEYGYNQNIKNSIVNISIPSNTIVIAPNTFAFYKKLEIIQFEENNKLIYLGDNAFAYCENLRVLDLRKCKNLSEIKENTFINSGIEHLKISNNITELSVQCILNMPNLKDITLEENCYKTSEFVNKMKECNNNIFWEESWDF